MKLAAIVLSILGLVLQPTTVSAQTAQPGEQLLEQFERALNAFDEDAVARLFATDGSLRDNVGGEAISAGQVRGWVRKARDNNLHAHLGDYSVSEGKTHFTIEVGRGEWFREGGGTPQRARGTAEVRNGRIVMLVLEPAAPTQATARITNQASFAGAPIGMVALAAGGAAAVLVGLLRGRTRGGPRQPSGELHAALGEWATARRRG